MKGKFINLIWQFPTSKCVFIFVIIFLFPRYEKQETGYRDESVTNEASQQDQTKVCTKCWAQVYKKCKKDTAILSIFKWPYWVYSFFFLSFRLVHLTLMMCKFLLILHSFSPSLTPVIWLAFNLFLSCLPELKASSSAWPSQPESSVLSRILRWSTSWSLIHNHDATLLDQVYPSLPLHWLCPIFYLFIYFQFLFLLNSSLCCNILSSCRHLLYLLLPWGLHSKTVTISNQATELISCSLDSIE